MAKNQSALTEPADEWLRTSDLRSILKCGESRLRQLIRENAFPVSRPSGRILYAKRSDVERFLTNGYTDKVTSNTP